MSYFCSQNTHRRCHPRVICNVQKKRLFCAFSGHFGGISRIDTCVASPRVSVGRKAVPYAAQKGSEEPCREGKKAAAPTPEKPAVHDVFGYLFGLAAPRRAGSEIGVGDDYFRSASKNARVRCQSTQRGGFSTKEKTPAQQQTT